MSIQYAIVTPMDQGSADRHRLNGGMVAYCPVCSRPMSNGVLDPHEALTAVAGHLSAEHDPYFMAMLRIALEAR